MAIDTVVVENITDTAGVVTETITASSKGLIETTSGFVSENKNVLLGIAVGVGATYATVKYIAPWIARKISRARVERALKKSEAKLAEVKEKASAVNEEFAKAESSKDESVIITDTKQ